MRMIRIGLRGRRPHWLAALAFASAMAGCGTTPANRAALDAEPTVVALAQQTTDFGDSDLVGTGAHRYRFVLNDTETGQPAANRRFALSHKQIDLDFVVAEKDVYQGVTDERGRTPTFALSQTADAAGWVLRERFGEGDFGEQMKMTSESDEPLSGVHYALVICGDSPQLYRGVSDANGLTGYAASAKAASVMLFVDWATVVAGDADEPSAISDAEDAASRCRSEDDDGDA